jgi:serine/threonine-protein kinase
MLRCKGEAEPHASPPSDGSQCSGEHTIAEFVAGLLAPGRLAAIDAHLEQCEACFALVAASAALADGCAAPRAPAGPCALALAGPPRLLSSRFEPLEILAWGATSVVYRGWDWLTGRPVAIKRLEPRPGKEAPECQRQFSVEAELLSRLDHPNIVRLVASVPHAGGSDIVLEHADGSLRDLLRRRSFLTVERSLRLLSKLCDGLAHVHDFGIVHRDIKPGNVLLTAGEVPQLADFGSAQLMGSQLPGRGQIVGTVGYLSPEAARGGVLDARADLWALGVMLFEMLTGELPFKGCSQWAILRAVLEDPTPPLRRALRGAPTALVALVENLLEKNREQRVPSARRLGSEITAILRTMERPTTGCFPAESQPVVARAETPARHPMCSGSGRASIHGTREMFQPLNAS